MRQDQSGNCQNQNVFHIKPSGDRNT